MVKARKKRSHSAALKKAAKELGLAEEEIKCEITGKDKQGKPVFHCVPKSEAKE